MKRKSFLQFTLAAGSLLTAPLSLLAKYRDRVGKGYKVGAGKDRFDAPITLMEGDTFFTKISTRDTNGDLFAFESTRIKKGGPPLHYHTSQDEWFYILSGEFLFKIGEETFTAKAGDSLYGPRMIPHAFTKTSEEEARMLIVFQPAGQMESHFKAVSQGLYKDFTDAQKQKMSADHGVVIVGPGLGHEK